MRSAVAMLLMLLAVGIGCGQKLVFPRLDFKTEESSTPSIPLTVRLDLSDALRQAQLFYRDSCNSPQAIPLGERLSDQIKADAARVFEKTLEGGTKDPADAVLTAALETGELSLNIPRREIGEYPVKVLLRLRLTVTDAEGAPLFNEVLKAEGKWTARTDGTACAVQGVMLPVSEAIEKLSDREVDSLTQSVRIRDAAIRLRTRQEMLAGGRVPSGVVGAGSGAVEAPGLNFRALLEDENRNQVLDAGERVVVRVEVSNSGPGIAKGVTVVLSGTPVLVKEFTNPTFLGDLRPGEKKQAVISTTLSSALAEQQAELFVQVTEANGFGVPTRKRFVAMMKPGQGSESIAASVEVLPVDVDQVPARVRGFERRSSYAVVIGVGDERGASQRDNRYAKRDAEMVAKHLNALAGFPSENIRVLTENHALLSDIQEVFEDWLPRKAVSSGIVLVYLVGSGMVGATGESMLLANDRVGEAGAPRGYSVDRIGEVLSRLPFRLKLVFADLSVGDVSGGSQAAGSSPVWLDRKLQTKGRTILVASSTAGHKTSDGTGQHGRFTYYFLKAIRGQADTDKNGWVDVGEVLSYLRDSMRNPDHLVIAPEIDPSGPIGTFPIAKIPGISSAR